MAGFQAEGVVEALDWDFNPYVKASGTIPEPTDTQIARFLAGLKAIPKELYEASAIDGVDSRWERFRRVTLPMLTPAGVFVVSITTIRSFQVFDTIASLTGGGPNKATNVLLFEMYQQGFSFLRSAYAAAITCVFLAFVLVKPSDCGDCSSVWAGRGADLTGARGRSGRLRGCGPAKPIGAVTGWSRPPPSWRAASTPSASRT